MLQCVAAFGSVLQQCAAAVCCSELRRAYTPRACKECCLAWKENLCGARKIECIYILLENRALLVKCRGSFGRKYGDALHSMQRALYFLKRALYSPKRASQFAVKAHTLPRTFQKPYTLWKEPHNL